MKCSKFGAELDQTNLPAQMASEMHLPSIREAILYTYLLDFG